MSLSEAAGSLLTTALRMSFELHPGSRPGPAKLFEATPETWRDCSATVQIRGPSTPAALINLSPVCADGGAPMAQLEHPAFLSGLQFSDIGPRIVPPPARRTDLHCASSQETVRSRNVHSRGK